MKVSIIIPTYNEEGVIAGCLKSLAKQTYKDMEVIVVDDGSTDTTLQKSHAAIALSDGALRDASKTGLTKLLSKKHKGAGSARNSGAKKAKGNILVFVDADMTFDKDFVKKLTEPIRKSQAVGTFSKEEYVSNPENVWARCWNINRGLPQERMHPPNYPDTQKVFRAIKKIAFEKVGGFDDKAGYTDDWSLSAKLGVEAVVAPGAKFYHRNPDTLGEVFIQSRWMAKRKYKLGIIGSAFALLRVSSPFSIVIGTTKAIFHRLPYFLPFKIVSDFGQFIGILEYEVLGKVAK